MRFTPWNSGRTRAAIATVAVVATVALWQFAPASAVVSSPVDEAVTTTVMPVSFADVIEAVSPAVVNISTVGAAPAWRSEPPNVPGAPWGRPFGDGESFEEFFRRFFERQAYRSAEDLPREARAQGSGFIIDPDGLVVTNYHVVDGADDVLVTLNDGTSLPATLIGHDPKTDLALLEVDADRPLAYARFGDSDATRVGDWVLAIGNPFGLGGTATTGIVSARGRDIRSGPFDDFLQIDAPINRGNSGGPLFDVTGKVIGVNTAIFSPNGGNVGIGFAIPASQARPIIDELRDHGRVERGWLGVMIQALDDDLAAGLGLSEVAGALVAQVVDDSPAAAAGLEPGDVITAFDGDPVTTIRDLTRAVAEAAPDREIAMELWRDGARTTVDVELGRSPDASAAPVRRRAAASPSSEGEVGVSLAPLSRDARRTYALGDDEGGVLVTGVRSGSPAAEAGLRRGDVIVRVGSEVVSEPSAVARRVEDARADDRDRVVLQVARGERRQYVAVDLRS